jgi:hypothetical protein
METQENKRGQKLYYYLSRLKEKEIRDLHDYLQSPLLGNSPQFARMLLTIQEKVLATERTTIDADLFQEEFSPGQPLDAKTTKYIRIRLVQFLDKVLDFASFMDYRSDRNARDIHLLKAMRTRGWEKYFTKVHAEVTAVPPIKADGEFLIYRLWQMVILEEFLTERTFIGNEMGIENIQRAIDELFIHIKLKYACSAINEKINANKIYSFWFSEEFLKIASEYSWKHSPETNAYYHTFLMLKSFEDDSIDGDVHFDLILQFLNSSDGIDPSEYLDCFIHANNYAQKKIRNGHSAFKKKKTLLYDCVLQSEALLETGMITSGFYKNTILSACGIGEIQWAENFLEEWKDRIAGDRDYLAYYHNKATIHFHRKEYDQTLDLLYNRVHCYEDAPYGLAVRVNICRALWEKGEDQWMISNLEAMRQFVNRLDNLGKSEKQGNMKFVNYLSRMGQARLGNPDKVFKRLLKIWKEMEAKKDHLRMVWVHKALVSELEKFDPKK